MPDYAGRGRRMPFSRRGRPFVGCPVQTASANVHSISSDDVHAGGGRQQTADVSSAKREAVLNGVASSVALGPA
ncbi:hypothetical protein A0H81_02104 [Grifola frondosa]|uniref:Uncharacterized protein n=1 Tax=Grifola frondosa TaxID=5627 RepID=A0A1C7MK30_GRIFR|nr:hypothetical protein A0H81_02104 [Grifola frondosa]